MVRKASLDDLGAIQTVYAQAREFMAAHGNPTQWAGGYPQEALLRDAIAQGKLFVFEEAGGVHGVFFFAAGPDPTYARIEEGAWLSDSAYSVIHMVAGDGTVHGLLGRIVNFCVQQGAAHLRIDTHADNAVMQHVILKNGFQRCGIIYLEDGDPRIAYEKV